MKELQYALANKYIFIRFRPPIAAVEQLAHMQYIIEYVTQRVLQLIFVGSDKTLNLCRILPVYSLLL